MMRDKLKEKSIKIYLSTIYLYICIHLIITVLHIMQYITLYKLTTPQDNTEVDQHSRKFTEQFVKSIYKFVAVVNENSSKENIS